MSTLGSYDFCLFLVARRGRNGCGILRKLLHERWDLSRVPESPLETIIQLVSSGLPLPMPQLEILDREGRFVARPDFVWPKAKLVVEGAAPNLNVGKATEWLYAPEEGVEVRRVDSRLDRKTLCRSSITRRFDGSSRASFRPLRRRS